MNESEFPQQHLAQPPYDPYFGQMLFHLRDNLSAGGSELGLGVSLFSLAVSIRAKRCLEIGRFKGFSTIALASAMRFNKMGWAEQPHNKQRPDVNYADHERSSRCWVDSVDIHDEEESHDVLMSAGLTPYVERYTISSQEFVPESYDSYDLLFIDGSHKEAECRADVDRFVPHLRSGGYFILHDYFGWYAGRMNLSPIKAVCDQLDDEGYEGLLIDTGYQSFKAYRKP